MALGTSPVDSDSDADVPQKRPHEGAWVRLKVRDTGHGMDPATKERVLEPFFTTREAGESTGLGLSVAHGIVVSHGGSLTVESEPEKGTTVHVYLPQVEQIVEEAVAS